MISAVDKDRGQIGASVVCFVCWDIHTVRLLMATRNPANQLSHEKKKHLLLSIILVGL